MNNKRREQIFKEKPHFYYRDLDNYADEFLKEIILWQKDYLDYLIEESSKEDSKNNKLNLSKDDFNTIGVLFVLDMLDPGLLKIAKGLKKNKKEFDKK